MRNALAILAILASACGPTAPRDHDTPAFVDGSPAPDPDREPAADASVKAPDAPAHAYKVDPTDTTLLPYHGGNGGSGYGMACPDGAVAVGLAGRSGVNLDQIAVVCAPLEEDGTLGSVIKTNPTGGAGGQPFEDVCPNGEILVGLAGRSDTHVNRIRGACASLAPWLAEASEVDLLSPHGGTGGSGFHDSCPQGTVLYGVKGLSGAMIDRIRGRCMAVLEL